MDIEYGRKLRPVFLVTRVVWRSNFGLKEGGREGILHSIRKGEPAVCLSQEVQAIELICASSSGQLFIRSGAKLALLLHTELKLD